MLCGDVIAVLVDLLEHAQQLFLAKLSIPVPYLELIDLFHGVTEHTSILLIRLVYLAALVKDNDTVRGLFEQNAPPRDFVLEQLLCPLALGGVARI